MAPLSSQHLLYEVASSILWAVILDLNCSINARLTEWPTSNHDTAISEGPDSTVASDQPAFPRTNHTSGACISGQQIVHPKRKYLTTVKARLQSRDQAAWPGGHSLSHAGFDQTQPLLTTSRQCRTLYTETTPSSALDLVIWRGCEVTLRLENSHHFVLVRV